MARNILFVRSAGLEPATFCFVVILLHRQGETVGDSERQNRAFIENLDLLRDTEVQEETPGCGQIAVKIGDSVVGIRAGSQQVYENR